MSFIEFHIQNLNHTSLIQRQRIQTFQKLYNQVYDGNPWHGPSLKSIRSRLNPSSLTKSSPSSGKSIAALLAHILAWRKFVLSKVNEQSIDICLNTEADWPTLTKTIDVIVEELDISFQELQKVLDTKDDKWLDEIVLDKEYTYVEMLYGLMNHDIHHYSQILFIDSEVDV